MFGQRRRRWANINPALVQRLVFVGIDALQTEAREGTNQQEQIAVLLLCELHFRLTAHTEKHYRHIACIAYTYIWIYNTHLDGGEMPQAYLTQ